MSKIPLVDRVSHVTPAQRREHTRTPPENGHDQPADIDRRKTRRDLPRTAETPTRTPPSPLGKIIDTFAIAPHARGSSRPLDHA